MQNSILVLIVSIILGSAYFTYKNIDVTAPVSAEGVLQKAGNMKFFQSEDTTESKIDINEFLSDEIENFRKDMKVGNPAQNIPVLDPFVSEEPIMIDFQDKTISVEGNFTDVQIEGLSTFIIDSLEADFKKLSVSLHLHIPTSKAYGHYFIYGQVYDIVPLRGNGEFRIEPVNLRLSVKLSLDTSEEYLKLAKDFDVEIDMDEVKLNLENFLGGSGWDEVLETLNTTKDELLDKFIPVLKGELNNTLFKTINKKLKKMPVKYLKPGSSANEYIDQILIKVQYYVIDKDLDPIVLPDYEFKFSKEIMMMNVNGEAKMFDGKLYGISSLHRTEDCKLKTNASTINISACLGLSALKLIYKGNAKFMSFSVTVTASGSIDKIAFFFNIQQSIKKGARPVLKELKIVKMSSLSLNLTGLGPLTWIMSWLLTGLSTLVEDFIHEKMTDVIRSYIQDELQKYPFPV